MIQVIKDGVILKPTDLPFEKKAVLNPGVWQDGVKVHVVYRAIDDDYKSSLGYARLEGPQNVAERWNKPFLYPKYKVEKNGIEDPRLVRIENSFFLTYVVHDGKNAITAFSHGRDLFNLKRGNIVSPQIPYKEAGKIFSYSKLKDEYYFFESYYQEHNGRNILIWHKDCVLFPERIGGQYFMLHRILPDIQVVAFDDFKELSDKYFWISNLLNLANNVVLEPVHGFESRHVGAGAPPVRTDAGWLMIYHSARETNAKRVYYAGAALLDTEDPRRIIARLPYPLMSPTEKFEIEGCVNDVVFPSGTAVFGEDLYIYYGAADTYICAAHINMKKLIDELLRHKVENSGG